MFTPLLCLGLIVSATLFIPGLDIRDMKMTAAITFGLALGVVELYRYGLKPLQNKWIGILLVYLMVSAIFAPTPTIGLSGVNVSNFWMWQPMFQIMVFFFMASAVASHEFSVKQLGHVITTISWMGAFSAFYVVLQKFNMDQFFKAYGSYVNDNGRMAGFLGNPTLAAPFIGMTIPFMCYQKKYWMVAIALIAVYFTESQVAIGATLLGLAFLIASHGKYRMVITALVAILSAVVLFTGYQISPKVRHFVGDNQRFTHWKQMAHDIKTPISAESDAAFPLTGRGIGSFRFIYRLQHPGTQDQPNMFHQAHNDYMELAYNCGVLGLIFLLFGIAEMFRRNFIVYDVFLFGNDPLKSVLLASFVVVAVAAGGTFVWQIGTTVYYSAFLIGMLHNKNLTSGRIK